MGDIYFVDDSEYKNPETLALHGGNYRFDPVTSAVTVPIYRSTSFQFRDTENAANLFALQEFGNIYSRMMNPTNDALEQRLAALEGGRAALSVSSGQAATTFCLLNVAQAGDNIVSITDLYGGNSQSVQSYPFQAGFRDSICIST